MRAGCGFHRCLETVRSRRAAAAPEQLKPGEFLWKPELSPHGPIVMVVSLTEQLAYVYRNGTQIGWSLYTAEEKP